MDSISQNIGNVVAIITAVLSEQEELAYSMVLDSDPIELFSSFTGILLSVMNSLSEHTNVSTNDYLQDLGMLAYKTQ